MEDDDDDERMVEEPRRELKSHFGNPDIPASWRYFVVFFLLAALGLLLAADIGSGVSAEYMLVRPNGEIFEHTELLVVSIFTSVRELWDTGSYPLAIFIAVTSVTWPYVKLILSFVAWVVPFQNARGRERLIEIVDAFDKWSFVDIFVLLIIMVAFRANIKLGFGGKSVMLCYTYPQGQCDLKSFLYYRLVIYSDS